MVASASEEVRPDILDRLFTYPVMLREFCCTVPGIHPCWHLYTFVSWWSELGMKCLVTGTSNPFNLAHVLAEPLARGTP